MSLEDALQLVTALADRVADSPGQVELVVSDGLARLTLRHAAARNALTAHMMRGLGEAVLALSAREDVYALVLASEEGGAFCAGGHLREVQQALGTPANGHQMALAMGAILDGLGALPIVSIAAMEGPAIGGGAELALSTDLRVMGANSQVHFVHTRLGVVPGWGGAGRLVDAVGRQRALTLLLEARPLSAEACAELGLAEVVDAGGALARALELARQVVCRGEAARAAKRAVLARGTRTAEQRALEAAAFGSVWGSEGHKAALAKVLERLG